jgi:hypothetical protein
VFVSGLLLCAADAGGSRSSRIDRDCDGPGVYHVAHYGKSDAVLPRSAAAVLGAAELEACRVPDGPVRLLDPGHALSYAPAGRSSGMLVPIVAHDEYADHTLAIDRINILDLGHVTHLGTWAFVRSIEEAAH